MLTREALVDPIRNPFNPGAGTQPPELAGRADEIQQIRHLMARAEAGHHEKSLMVTGLRGVGKTVLLNRLLAEAEENGWAADLVEVRGPKDHPAEFREVMATMCRRTLLELGRDQQVMDVMRRALRTLRSFRPTATPTESGSVEFSFGIEPMAGIADSGQLDRDLGDLFIEIGKVAREKRKGIILLLDEVQNLATADLAALITALHRVDQKGLPVTAVAAGLPRLPTLASEAKSYAERLFDFRKIGQLSVTDTKLAFTEADDAVKWEKEALDILVAMTDRYPHFIQEWGKQAWNVAPRSPIRARDVEAAHGLVMDQLDRTFFRDRANRATERERQYLAAMASLGDGPYRSAAVAAAMDTKPQAIGLFRDHLIHKGLIYAPDHGLVDFTVPHFADYMRRSTMAEH
jgi:hypothetical protein